jgi:peroxiredoxin
MRYTPIRFHALSRILSSVLLLSIIAAGVTPRAASAADQPAAAAPPAVLHLTDGSFLPGSLVDTARPGVLRWQASSFASPFEFPVDRVNAIHWPPPAVVPKPDGELCFELAGGDVVFGSLISLSEKQAELEIPRIGRLRVDRSIVHRIYRWHGSADLVYLGPNGMAGWNETVSPQNPKYADMPGTIPPPREAAPPQKGWREESGQLVTDRDGASIQGNFTIPAKAVIEFEMSWKSKPDFVFALGVNENDMASVRRAFRFEAWGSDLVIQRELETDADLAVVQEITPGPGRVHLQAYLDQEAGRILVCSQGGKQLASLKMGGPQSKAYPGLYLSNVRGNLRLEWLRIGTWSGELPREVNVNQSRVHRADGSIVYGQVAGFDFSSSSYLLKNESGESRIPQNTINAVFLSVPGDDKPRAIRAVYQDGTRLSGDLDEVENSALILKVPGVSNPPKLPTAGLRSLVATRHPGAAPLARSELTGMLDLDGLRMPGRLVDGDAQAGATCLVWQPLGSDTASALKPGVSGKIIYREPPPPAPPRAQVQAQNQGMIFVAPQAPAPPAGVGGMVVRFAQALAESPTETTSNTEERRSLYLRDGDVIPSIITKIDADGVWFKTSLSKSTFVAHAKVKAVELANDVANTTDKVVFTRSKRDRLLTLPRMQKADPPTHIIRSKNGDYLRGRVTKLDAKSLEVEVRLENKELPRERISRIIWLHADELDETKKPPAPPSEGNSTRVQVLRNDGVRLTFQADHFAGDSLSGKSEVLGACAVAVSRIDQLLIGRAVDQAAAQLAYQQWKLKNAPEPKYVTAADGADGTGGDTGTESPLVGKPAPDFTLGLVGGKSFHLADSKGKEVIVLDFWATWCGPCLQAMPQVERAAAQFKDQNVRLVAVNLQETAAQVTALLERQKLHVTVALDHDGTVADKYKAAAIPQTVIIGRDGNIARLFVGGGPHLEAQLKEAITAVLGGDKPKDPNKAP